MSAWTQFHDMHSGGRQKLAWQHIFIEAPAAEAKVIFQNRFGRNPDRVTCTCCGPDYSVTEEATLAAVTAWERGCEYDEAGKEWIEKPAKKYAHGPYVSLAAYLASAGEGGRDSHIIIEAKDILPAERVGELKRSGYVWVDE